jgi:hypothetical protein
LEFVRGDDPDNQVANSIPNEVAQFCDNPADFPVNKVNIRTLQMTSGLSSDQQLIAMRKVWNTNGFEDEAIIPFSTTVPLTTQLDGKRKELQRGKCRDGFHGFFESNNWNSSAPLPTVRELGEGFHSHALLLSSTVRPRSKAKQHHSQSMSNHGQSANNAKQSINF